MSAKAVNVNDIIDRTKFRVYIFKLLLGVC